MVRTPFRLLAALAILLITPSSLMPCPFCSALSSTLSEDIKASHWAFLAVCIESADFKDDEKPPIHQFKLVSKLKSQSESKAENSNAVADVKLDDIVEIYSLQQYEKDQVVLLLGNTADELTDWTGSEPLSSAAQEYLERLVKLPSVENKERLKFFLPALQSEDKLIASDAYNEFALASLELMNSLKPHLNVRDIVEVIEDPRTSSELRRLHWTLLGICGSSSELTVVERAMEANLANANGDIGMDAVFSCYLVLGGERALENLERDYLANPNSSFTNCFALVGALRVHAEQIKTIDQARICQSFRLALGRSSLAELVIPDLARWEDWTVIDQMVELFSKTGDGGEKQSYKIPIVNYLRNCPLPEARLALAKCEQIDPEVVRKTTVLFPSR